MLTEAVAREAGERTVFQNLLPVELIKAECVDAVLKTTAYQRSLSRLAGSVLAEVGTPANVEWEPAAAGV